MAKAYCTLSTKNKIFFDVNSKINGSFNETEYNTIILYSKN